MKNRFISELKKHFLICFIGFAYYLWIVNTNLYIPCIFKMITGLKCPGCGISHMIVAVFRFDFLTAFYSNPLLFVASPVIGIIYITKKVYYIKNGIRMKNGKLMNFLLYTMIVLLIIFWIIRNIPIN